MPKEAVQRASTPDCSDVTVHWSKEQGHVQVAITRYGEIWTDPDANSTTLYSEAMTRYELNQMIKTLRRARDQAYGRDE
ncbi:hypothetical protein PP304_gp205 [Gordonia phage Phendrix]|uniref:Uncharacterized protein n=1 Tax=Gordonia phage Phendrix TaxID=2593335 RepID=A0A514U178_9CAUD|nr:hypothetical protein PP304_gp205 [Gordonia phage Phendrix]QDK02666.1 hypothetical protein SEA_PHENDRIX_128 [Gordonia phage Phendrix]